MFEVGKIAVAKNSSDMWKKGDEFQIDMITKGCCGQLLLGLFIDGIPSYCEKCAKCHSSELYDSRNFEIKESWENQDISELTEVIKNPRLTPTTYQIID